MNEKLKIDEIKQLLNKKKLTLLENNASEEDLKKIEVLENLFNNDRCFFNIQFDSAINILRFLGISESNLLETYKELTDYELVKGNIKFKQK